MLICSSLLFANLNSISIYLQKEAKNNITIFKTLYSVVLKLSKKYERIDNYALAGLLKNKSENIKYHSDSESEYGWMYNYFTETPAYSYNNIEYFDDKASPSDIDSVLRIINLSSG